MDKAAPKPLLQVEAAAQQTAPISEQEGWVRLAQLVRPHGIRGALAAEILTDFPERFSERQSLFLQPSSRVGNQPSQIFLEQHRVHKGRLIFKFANVDSIDAAELLRGCYIVIPRAERVPLEEGAVYIADLVGCALYDRRTAELVGSIVDVDRESSNIELLVVERLAGTKQRTEILIPFANAYDPRIDLLRRRMEMTLPEGLVSVEDLPASRGSSQD